MPGGRCLPAVPSPNSRSPGACRVHCARCRAFHCMRIVGSETTHCAAAAKAVCSVVIQLPPPPPLLPYLVGRLQDLRHILLDALLAGVLDDVDQRISKGLRAEHGRVAAGETATTATVDSWCTCDASLSWMACRPKLLPAAATHAQHPSAAAPRRMHSTSSLRRPSPPATAARRCSHLGVMGHDNVPLAGLDANATACGGGWESLRAARGVENAAGGHARSSHFLPGTHASWGRSSFVLHVQGAGWGGQQEQRAARQAALQSPGAHLISRGGCFR